MSKKEKKEVIEEVTEETTETTETKEETTETVQANAVAIFFDDFNPLWTEHAAKIEAAYKAFQEVIESQRTLNDMFQKWTPVRINEELKK